MTRSTTSSAAIAVHIAFDAGNDLWVAPTSEAPNLLVRARTYPKARGRMRRLLSKVFERKVRTTEHLELPAALAADVRSYQHLQEEHKRLTAALRAARMPLVHRLLELRFGQSDVAALIDASPAQVGAWLEKEGDTPQLSPESGELHQAAE